MQYNNLNTKAFFIFGLFICTFMHATDTGAQEQTQRGIIELPVLQELTQQVVVQMKKYQQLGTKPWDYQIAAKDLPCQVGSLLKYIMQLNNERFAHGKSQEQIRDGIADELADILSLVLFIAHELDIDLKDAWTGMLKSDECKFERYTRIKQ